MASNSSSGLDKLFLLLCIAPIFLFLGSGEVQSWDEGLFALRARAVIDHDSAWWNQTEHAAGGLYSATYPPLSVWGMTAFMAPFGESAWSVRLFAALCGAGGIVLLFGIVRRRMGRWPAYLAAALLGGALSWLVYARFAMSDVPLMFFCLGALTSLLRLVEADEQSQVRRWTLLFGLCFWAALMTKIVVSFLPLLFVMILWFAASLDAQKRKTLLWSSLAAMLAAAPWYFNMLISYGPEFYSALAPPHLYKMAEGGPQSRSWWFYLNRLLVDTPLLLAGLGGLLPTLWRRIRGDRKVDVLLLVSAVWFVFTFVVFSLAKTRMPHYILMMLPPLVIGIAHCVYDLTRAESRPSVWQRLAIGSIPLALPWSLSEDLRSAIRDGFAGADFGPAVWLLPALILALFVWRGAGLTRFAARVIIILCVGAALSLHVRAWYYSFATAERQDDGAVRVAALLERSSVDSLLVLTHARNLGDLLVPQLTWYTDGWALNRRAGRFAEVRGLPEWQWDPRLLEVADELWPNATIVYHFSPDYGAVVDSTSTRLQEKRQLLETETRYMIFSEQFQSDTVDVADAANADTTRQDSMHQPSEVQQQHDTTGTPPGL